ncbi:class I lanthipeptide [Chitinophaga flava]|nr:class I lanthipeptide [Chitinophaga flava]
MKKKKLSLSKKLFVQKETISLLSQEQQHGVIGGARTTYGCPTWLPNAGCLTETTPQILCI